LWGAGGTKEKAVQKGKKEGKGGANTGDQQQDGKGGPLGEWGRRVTPPGGRRDAAEQILLRIGREKGSEVNHINPFGKKISTPVGKRKRTNNLKKKERGGKVSHKNKRAGGSVRSARTDEGETTHLLRGGK